MILKSRNCQLLVFILLLILPFSLQFSLQSLARDQKDLIATLRDQYQVTVGEDMNLEVLKLHQQKANIKASTIISCIPQEVSIEEEEGTQTVIKADPEKQLMISVICKNKEKINYKYITESNTLSLVQTQRREQLRQNNRIVRLLQNTTTVCGNAVVETGQTCDDGNSKSGDGCSANCTLQCGDGILNTATEQCDDGNRNDGDGCSSTCKKQDTNIGLSLGLGIGLGGAALIGLIIGKVVLSRTTASAVAGAAPQHHVSRRALEVEQSTKVMNPSGNLY